MTLRLPGLERLEVREEDRSVETRDRTMADERLFESHHGAVAAGADSPAALEGADKMAKKRYQLGEEAKGPVMRRPADWQASEEYLVHEKRAPRMAAFNWLNPVSGAGQDTRDKKA